MYRPTTTRRDRAATIAAVVTIHVALGYAFLNLSGPLRTAGLQDDLQIFDIADQPPPPPPLIEKPPEPEKARPRREEGAASPENIESEATPVVAPEPRVIIPSLVPIIASPTPNVGEAATQGASDVVGPGTGAGGLGTGTGGSGSGSGGGGLGGGETRPTIVEYTKLTSRDYPAGALRAWPRNGKVFVAVRVQIDGRATDCKVNRSSGNPAIDGDTCRLVMAKVRFNPARDRQGRPYVDWYGYIQEPVGRW